MEDMKKLSKLPEKNAISCIKKDKNCSILYNSDPKCLLSSKMFLFFEDKILFFHLEQLQKVTQRKSPFFRITFFLKKTLRFVNASLLTQANHCLLKTPGANKWTIESVVQMKKRNSFGTTHFSEKILR